MKNKSYIGISFIVLLFGIWAVPKIVAKFQKSDLHTIGPVPGFELTDQNNKKISDKDYLGKVYVVEFFFCTDLFKPFITQLARRHLYGDSGATGIFLSKKSDAVKRKFKLLCQLPNECFISVSFGAS